MSSQVGKKVIFSCPSLYVISQLFDGDDVVVTFNNRGDLCGGDRFWGDVFFEKSGISAIGICATSANWFPPEDMDRAIQAIRNLIGDRRVITYGSSMGGYGALKFSKKLRAHATLAFSPQWSIKADECGTYTNQYTEHYDPILKGGEAIIADDLYGRCIIFLDPYEIPDIHHAAKIMNAAEKAPHTICERVLAPFTWHGTVFQLISAGSRYSRRLLELARQREHVDIAQFRRLLRESRPDSVHYAETRFFCLSYRMAQRQDASARSLRNASLVFPNQEGRLIRALMDCKEGNIQKGLQIIAEEVDRDWLRGTSDWAMTRILDIARMHKLHDAERLFRRCFRDRVPENMHELFMCSNALADIGFGDEAAWDMAAYLSDHPSMLENVIGDLEAFAIKINRPQLSKLLHKILHSHGCRE